MSRRQIAWGTGTTVLLAAASSALINELHQGWPWWLAAVVASGIGAVLAARLSAERPVTSGSAVPESDTAEQTGAAEASGGGQANSGVIVADGGRPVRAYMTGPATSKGPGSIANSGVIRQPGDPR